MVEVHCLLVLFIARLHTGSYYMDWICATHRLLCWKFFEICTHSLWYMDYIFKFFFNYFLFLFYFLALLYSTLYLYMCVHLTFLATALLFVFNFFIHYVLLSAVFFLFLWLSVSDCAAVDVVAMTESVWAAGGHGCCGSQLSVKVAFGRRRKKR